MKQIILLTLSFCVSSNMHAFYIQACNNNDKSSFNIMIQCANKTSILHNVSPHTKWHYSIPDPLASCLVHCYPADLVFLPSGATDSCAIMDVKTIDDASDSSQFNCAYEPKEYDGTTAVVVGSCAIIAFIAIASVLTPRIVECCSPHS